MQWPTLLTLALSPVLVIVYRGLAIAEEREVTQRFGSLYADYSRYVPRFIPRWKDPLLAEPKNSAHAGTGSFETPCRVRTQPGPLFSDRPPFNGCRLDRTCQSVVR